MSETAETVEVSLPAAPAGTDDAVDPEVLEARDRLNQLLDSMGTNKRTRDEDADVEFDGNRIGVACEWSRHWDPSTGMYYYYSHQTAVTQWEVPDNYVEPNASSGMPSADYTASASFSSKNGAFSGSGDATYWEQVGRPNDREGRQMSAFFDMTTFEENRAEAKAKKEALQKSGIDWRKYKEEKKLKKQKIRNRWLYEDEN